MAARVCVECTTVYAVGAPRCPHCGATASVEQGEPMPKITRLGGASSRHDSETAGAVTEPPATAAPARELKGEHGPELVGLEGGEQVWPGKSSSPSSEKPPMSSEPSKPSPRKPARMTASRSKKARTGASSARSTDGDLTADTSASEESGS